MRQAAELRLREGGGGVGGGGGGACTVDVHMRRQHAWSQRSADRLLYVL